MYKYTDSLKSHTIKGLSWSLADNLIRQFLNFAILMCLARLLSPKEFGIVGMVTVFTGFISIFVEQGFGSAIIQKQNIEQRHLNSIFWLNLFFGVLCAVILSFVSLPIARFYKEPILRPVTILISVNFLISSLNIVQNALLIKQINFKKLAIINTISVLCAGGIGIWLALTGFGVWSLIWQSIALAGITAVVTWIMSPWRPLLEFDISAIKDIFGFSSNILGYSFFNYWVRNFDNLLVGRYIGDFALGIYSRAYQLMLLPLSQVSWVASRVMFPILSVIQQDVEKVKRVYLKSTQGIALVTFPLMVGLFTVSKHFVLAVFGDKWVGLVPLLSIFCWIGMSQSVSTTVGWIYNSQGRTDLQFKWGIFTGVVYLPSFIIGLHWGVIGIAMAYAVSSYAILWYPSWSIPGRLINLRFSEMLRNLSGPFYCSLVMGILVWVLGRILPNNWQSWGYLVVQIPSGVVIYVILIHTFRLPAFEDLKKIILSFKEVPREGAGITDYPNS